MTYTRTVKSHQTFYITQRKLFSHSDLISEVIIERLEPRLTRRSMITQRKHFSHSDLISEVIIERLEPRLRSTQIRTASYQVISAKTGYTRICADPVRVFTGV